MFFARCTIRSWQRCQNIIQRLLSSSAPKPTTAIAVLPENVPIRQRLFTGIQPTGSLHLGNYLGVVKKWVEMQHTKEDALLCIADMHSITLAKDPPTLREYIFRMAAALLATGVDLEHTALFVQSAVKEHSELTWILSTMSSMSTLGHQPIYMEKTRMSKEIPLGVFAYPVLQAADILLYKSTHVPIGEDQVSHVRFAQSLVECFNSIFDKAFPVCKPVLAEYNASRVRGLTDPSKKMSKSDDLKSTIYMTDEPDDILAKIRDATTDFASDVRYDPDKRAGIANLISIHANIVGKTPEEIVVEAATMDTMKYKNIVAEAVIEHLTPIRRKYLDLLDRRGELVYQLDSGAARARVIAADTMDDVKQRMGLGAIPTVPRPILQQDVKPRSADSDDSPRKKRRKLHVPAHIPVVPKQQLREEKSVGFQGLCVAIRNKY